MVTNAETSLPQQPLTRRELRERERAAEREAQLNALREKAAASVAENVKSETASAAEPQFLTRRERREAERREEAALREEAAIAARAAFESNATNADQQQGEVVVPEQLGEQIVDTLDPTTAPIAIAPVISLDEVRAARDTAEVEGSEAVADDLGLEAAPADEAEIHHAFLRRPNEPASKSVAEILRLRTDEDRNTGRHAGRFGGSMVAMSLLAGTVALGAGSATAISALNSASGDEALRAEAEANAQSLSVDGGATPVAEAQTQRGGDITVVQSIGSAASANIATGVKLPDKAAYTNDLTANVQYPFPMGVKITDGYGLRDAPAGASAYHGGVDFTPGEGTPIGVLADGVVTKVDESQGSSFGVFVEVQHEINGERITTLYAHIKPGTVAVAEGDELTVGDEVGRVGNTGISTGPHLHLEVHIGDKYVDPMYFLKKMNVDGVRVSLPTVIATAASEGNHEKLSHEASSALVDELAAKNGE